MESSGKIIKKRRERRDAAGLPNLPIATSSQPRALGFPQDQNEEPAPEGWRGSEAREMWLEVTLRFPQRGNLSRFAPRSPLRGNLPARHSYGLLKTSSLAAPVLHRPFGRRLRALLVPRPRRSSGTSTRK